MTTTPTQLPVPSEKPQDLKFNAGKIDEFVTSQGWTYTDRFGNKHYTIEGLRWLAQQAISQYGYITLKSFQVGAPLPNNELTLPNQALLDEVTGEYYRWDGAFPKSVPSGSTPESTGGIGDGKWLSVGDATLRPLVEVTANLVGTNNYTSFPGIGGTITAGHDYLYNDILYTTVGDSGVVQSVSGNVVTTDNGTAYLLDKRWPITDVRAWGVRDGALADEELTNCVTYITRKGGGGRTIHVPGIELHLNAVTLTDLSTVNIHFSGTFIVGRSTTPKNAIVTINNAHTASLTGTIFMDQVGNNYTYGLYATAALPSLIAPATGILHKLNIQDLKVNMLPCAVKIGDGSDAQMSEVNIGLITSRCNCGLEAAGSQTIVSVTGQVMSEPQAAFTYEKTAYLAIGAIIYHNGGEVLCSVDNDSRIATVAPVASTLYGNPCGSVKVTGAHVESAGLLMYARQGSGIGGSVDSKYSCVSFSNCQGSMLNGDSELISIPLLDYEGTFSADTTCNFYTSATRNKKIVYSTSPKFNFEVSPRAFRKGFGVLASEIGSGNVNWHHAMQPIIFMSVDVAGVAANSTSPLGFSSRKSTDDYAFYFGDTSSGGLVLVHGLDCMLISISIPASDSLSILVKIGGVEVFGCINSGSVTLTKEMIPVGSVISFEAKNGTASVVTTVSSARVVISGSNAS